MEKEMEKFVPARNAVVVMPMACTMRRGMKGSVDIFGAVELTSCDLRRLLR